MLGRISNQRRSAYCLLVAFGCAWLFATNAAAQTTAFTYQGRLTDGGTSANGNYDLQFALWDSSSGGSQIGSTQQISTVAVSSGVFAVTLDFGANAFPGANRFLEISARVSGASAFILLSPRQQITSTPYAVRSGNATIADTATNATQLGGVSASQYVQTNDARLTDSRAPTTGSSNYVQNSTNQQSSSNFNISGNGTAGGMLSGNIVSAATQFNIGVSRVLTSVSSNFGESLFAGIGAGQANTTGGSNTFVGSSAGRSNTTGSSNSFFGFDAGVFGTTGCCNSFFGVVAGENNNADDNSFFGFGAGLKNTTGTKNAFFGTLSGNTNLTGSNDAFFGYGSGVNNTASDNSFFGASAGVSNTTGSSNSFFGKDAGSAN